MSSAPANQVDPPPRYEPPAPGYQPTSGYPPNPQYGFQSPPYPPPPAGVIPVNTNTVILQQPHTMALHGSTCRYGQYPAMIVCQHCQATVTTSISYETGLMTWAVAGGICLVGLWLGCCLIPFCIDGTKDVEHRCPNCKAVVGKFRHFG